MNYFKKQKQRKNRHRFKVIRRRMEKAVDSFVVDYPECEREGILRVVAVADIHFRPMQMKLYAFIGTGRSNSHHLYDEKRRYMGKTGFARGLREIAKDWPPVLSDHSCD